MFGTLSHPIPHTLRGIKKCPRCGCLNGNRSIKCKNKNCIQVLRQTELKKPLKIHAVQLITDDSNPETKWFSVTVRGRSSEFRSFVHIVDKTIQANELESIVNIQAICYADTCKYDPYDKNISCKHVNQASCTKEKATPISITKEMIKNCVYLPPSLRATISNYLDFCHASTIPILQKVTKNHFVIHTLFHEDLNGLNFTHVRFLSDGKLKESIWYCDCKKKESLMDSDNTLIFKENDLCRHICLLIIGISNSEYSNEYRKEIKAFQEFWSISEPLIGMEDLPILEEEINSHVWKPPMEDENLRFVKIPSSDLIDSDFTSSAIMPDIALELTDCQIELMDHFKLTDQIELCNDDIEIDPTDHIYPYDCLFDIDTSLEGQLPITTKTEVLNIPTKKRSQKLTIEVQKPLINQQVLASKVNMEFNLWLSSVIEMINNSMDYNGNGRPAPITLTIPNNFFTALRDRFQFKNKKRLPNSTTLITTGRYKNLTKDIYKFSSIKWVEQIFSTDKIKLETERYFIEVGRNSYELIQPCDSDPLIDSFALKSKHRRIKPMEFKTYLKCNPMSKPFKEPCAPNFFVIEWIGNVLPISNFGEVTFIYEYGKKKNNEPIAI